ncbi:hypothetical protein B0G82_7701 [Paraburkholderia sp. BL17N1]|nr:hypothetical protein B0G82_7701 [Paraburkholderia sp. BL17N1]
MSSNGTSLRSLIDKWLAPAPGSTISLSRPRHAKTRSIRCVRVESLGASGAQAIFFFRHDDGSWCVFPPALERPSFRAIAMTE